mmetsp:Transcript_8746/g.26885  ORF Transcript_8746/g.26885 Transcript_8746/m.26885 type:complete len:226 (-) Transcript_8746:279-956(-)|eukprot:scaffold92113_cov33-Tisochrysis_lutea.AAC.4
MGMARRSTAVHRAMNHSGPRPLRLVRTCVASAGLWLLKLELAPPRNARRRICSSRACHTLVYKLASKRPSSSCSTRSPSSSLVSLDVLGSYMPFSTSSAEHSLDRSCISLSAGSYICVASSCVVQLLSMMRSLGPLVVPNSESGPVACSSSSLAVSKLPWDVRVSATSLTTARTESGKQGDSSLPQSISSASRAAYSPSALSASLVQSNACTGRSLARHASLQYI